MAAKRTLRTFTTTTDPWPVITAWASANGYKRMSGSDGQAVFKKGMGILVAPRMLELRTEGNQLHLQAWVHSGFFVRLMSLFILPSEITVESGGFVAMVPRNIGRKEVNGLLAQLQQPQIT
jgi:hypothetical protein